MNNASLGSIGRPAAPEFFSELQGLRGLLSLWVLFFHIFAIDGISVPEILNGSHAVKVFFSLSGFVIIHVHSQRKEPYSIFIARRFFRLWPVYAICVSVAGLLTVVGTIPHPVTPGTGFQHTIFHVFMLHGVPSNAWLPNAGGAFLNPAWSISVEWQFYLIIPLIFFGRKHHSLKAGILLMIFANSERLWLGLGGYQNGTILPFHAASFTLGIVSYFIFTWVRSLPKTNSHGACFLPFLLPLTIAPFVNLNHNVSALIWLSAFGLTLSKALGNPLSLGLAAMNSKTLTNLGLVSYSLYLCHEPIVWSSRQFFVAIGFEGAILFWGSLSLSLLISIPVSFWLFRFIEKPAIHLGKRLISKFERVT